MKVLSLFSGVGGFDMGLEAAGMTTVFQCEIDKHARAVLDHHWPDVPKWDDVSTLTGAHILNMTGGVDIVAWGSPCQDLSLAGKRAGLSGERSGLFHEGIRIIKELRELSNGKYPTWSIWENVVGALSSNGGADFGEVLHEMDEAGACFSEWTVLDAQYFGVPQRRRRVFVTSCFDPATSERCGSSLFPVAESLPRDSETGSSTRKGTAVETEGGVGTGGGTGVGTGIDPDVVGCLGPTFGAKNYSNVQEVSQGSLVLEPQTFAKSRRAQSVNDHETWVESDVTPTLNVFDTGDTRTTTAIVEATPIQDGRDMEKHQNGLGIGAEGDPSYTLDSTGAQAVAYEPLMLDGRRVNDVRVYTEPVQTLQERMGTGGNNVPVVAQDTFAAGFKPGSSSGARSIGYEEQLAPTLESGGGGNNKPAIVQESVLSFDTQFGSNANVFENQSPTLKASQQSPSIAHEPVLMRQREGKPGGGKGPLLSDTSLTLAGANDQTLFQPETEAVSYDGYNQKVEEEVHRSWRIGRDSSDFVADLREPQLVVRRLTPLECERLMGWPDNHTAVGTNGPVSDTNRYKMCGNGVASPVAAWLARHLPRLNAEAPHPTRSFMDMHIDAIEEERARDRG